MKLRRVKNLTLLISGVILIIGLILGIYMYNAALENRKSYTFTPPTARFGVWWWTVDNLENLSYLDFAKKNGITEIYLNQHHLSVVNPNGEFGPVGLSEVVEPTRNFIRNAKERGIDVFLLLSNTGSWLTQDDQARFHHIMLGFLSYQQLVEDDEQFLGIHFNIEPNQLVDDEGMRVWLKDGSYQEKLMQQLIDFAVMVTDRYGDYTTFDWATGFWWENFMVSYRSEYIPLHHAMILEANATHVMSFRNTAQEIVDVARGHLDFAKKMEREIFLGANIASTEGLEIDQFYHLGRAHLNAQLMLIPKVYEYEFLHLVIHEMSRWKHWTFERE